MSEIILREDRLRARVAELEAENKRLKTRNTELREWQSAYQNTIAGLRDELRQTEKTLRLVKPLWRDAPDDATWLWIHWKWADDSNVVVTDDEDGLGFYSERRPMEEVAE